MLTFKSLCKILIAAALLANVALAQTKKIVTSDMVSQAPVRKMTREELIAAVEDRLEFLAANPGIAPGNNPGAAYRNVLEHFRALKEQELTNSNLCVRR